ncbi:MULTISPECIES: sigma-70 family RNA polymerase sigma factor [unclassified Pseudomonas]|uniref:sigma-70 family RNA polymerase sigma factor n=1 Tax=unclassified Pseudomonas TaxID=196821 RepID=UPI002449FC6C|nr:MULTISPECIES: sigma-70 family RNA polymerase sigma factor [unclassified Pseudomonas]MDG9929145.1 sigma-70 family RNA polymerase sigma factor [Pseudomonas sp. GD04042]MDH0484073.1 sigma-70 family RNA polymerase sigma factor [Pseudomonas sp. GD04015]MDH0605881.1 sigma-70 family RNA polymerase sigma factor [Pseudomonas sp. GD03869]MDH0897113.1 sigma-70 family RNA polymerase sigma factor [Pseudomonas sp. GD03875]MDH1065018.1 sigma-70 family RNA polymerase sigma factor [Pseudomonas sp. GD03985]
MSTLLPDAARHAQLDTLYREHHGWLNGWLRQRLNNSADAADLAQDTFVRVLLARTAGGLREPRHYLTTIARGLVIDLYRRRSLEQAYRDALASLPEAVHPSLEEQAILFEALLEIDRLLDGLGAKVRQTFVLSQCEGLTYAQIAERLGISLRTVNNHMARAMEHCCLVLAGLS